MRYKALENLGRYDEARQTLVHGNALMRSRRAMQSYGRQHHAGWIPLRVGVVAARSAKRDDACISAILAPTATASMHCRNTSWITNTCWRATTPGTTLDVSYADLVHKPAAALHKMFAFSELE